MSKMYTQKTVSLLLSGLLVAPVYAGPKVSGGISNTSAISNAINNAINASRANAGSVDIVGESIISETGLIFNDSTNCI